MRNKILFVLLFSSVLFYGQSDYSGKIEVEYLLNNLRLVDVDPGPKWQGYHLDDNQNGIGVNIINGIQFNDRFFVGGGIGFQQFQKTSSYTSIPGISLFANGEYVKTDEKGSVIFYSNLGYSHLWNQYENGTGSFLAEGGIGYNKGFRRHSAYIKGGVAVFQQFSFFKFGVGFRY